MKILITGATGLVGTALLELCRSRNIDVNYLTTNRNKLNSQDDYQGFYWNPQKGEIDPNCFNGVTAIINLAGASISKRWTALNKKIILDSRIDSLRTLYKALENTDSSAISSFVSASAIGRYPNSFCDFFTEEEAKVDNSFLGEVVAAWESEIARFNVFNFSVSQIRIGLVLSKSGGALPQMVKPIRNYVGAAFGSGKQWQSWIHIDDLARIFLFVIDHNLGGTFNGVAPNPVTNAKLVKEIAEVHNRPLFLPNIPEFLMRKVLGEMSYLLFASQRVSSKKIEKLGFDFNFQNVNAALQNIYGLDEKQKNAGPLVS